jgi:hypothetical protein
VADAVRAFAREAFGEASAALDTSVEWTWLLARRSRAIAWATAAIAIAHSAARAAALSVARRSRAAEAQRARADLAVKLRALSVIACASR